MIFGARRYNNASEAIESEECSVVRGREQQDRLVIGPKMLTSPSMARVDRLVTHQTVTRDCRGRQVLWTHGHILAAPYGGRQPCGAFKSHSRTRD